MTMREIRMPDGTIARFPASMSDGEIAAILAEQFRPAPALPAELRDGERLQRPNGAAIKHNTELQRHFVIDGRGLVVGWRVTLAEAIALADAQAAPARQPEPKPMPAERVPSADEIAIQQHADVSKHIRQQRSDAVREARREWHRQQTLHPALRRR